MLETLVTQYGYPIIFLGTLLEGETVLVLGGVAAHLGYLSLDGVILSGLGGTLFGDQLFFLLGRLNGQSLLARHPAWKLRAERVFRLMEQRQNWLILGFRFLYGLRVVTPFALGTSEVAYRRFAALNLIGAGTWVTCISLVGYYFGKAVHSVVGDIEHYELWLMTAIAGTGLLVWVLHLYRRHRSGHRG